jgi:hypothetical protein
VESAPYTPPPALAGQPCTHCCPHFHPPWQVQYGKFTTLSFEDPADAAVILAKYIHGIEVEGKSAGWMDEGAPDRKIDR